MLTNLKIENVAVIEKANIFFENGLNILTGETGAGKSIVIDSINAVLGERTSKEIVRTGKQSAKVTAFFEDIGSRASDVLDELEIEQESDNSLLISRTITADGRSSCKVNGQPITASMLKRLGRELITICGQHDSQHLLQRESHLSYIDSIAGCEGTLEEYRELYHKLLSLKREYKKLSSDESDKQSRLDFLQYQINELENANITVGEKESLQAEKKKIQNYEKIMDLLYGAKTLIDGGEDSLGFSSLLRTLSSILSQLCAYNSEFEPYSTSVESFSYEIDDCLSKINSEIDFADGEEIDINSIEERLDVLYRLSKKYGASEEDMLAYLEKAKEEYDSIAFSSERKAELESEIEKLSEEVFKHGCFISDCRKAAALVFEKQVMAELDYLDMKDAVFTVNFIDEEPGENGIDDVEFLISANKGQEPKPLSKIASGGELSRIMLAIRCVLSQSEQCDSMIFDEIDTGVSGRAAHKIAYKLKQVSSGKQVICVTHLAQIAASADSHLLIEKSSDDGETFTSVRKLESDEREHEIARIIGGDVITPTTLSSAKELIEFSSKP